MNKWLIKVGLGLALGLAVTTGVGQAKALPTVTPDPNASQIPWTYDQSTYKAGIETYRITRGEVMKGNHGKRYLLIHCIVTNNSDKEQTPSNIYMVVKAYQTVDGNEEQLSQSVVPVKKNGKNPYQVEADGLNNSLKPGKSKRAVMVFELKNQADVQVKFENPEQAVIGVEKFTLGKQVKHQTVKTGEETGTQTTTATNTNQATTANQANGTGKVENDDLNTLDIHQFVNKYGVSPARYRMENQGMSEQDALKATPDGMKTSGEIQLQNLMNESSN